MSDTEKKRKIIIDVAFYLMLGAGAYFLYRYAFGLCFPVVFAFLLAAILQGPKNFLVRKTFLKKGPAGVLCVLTLFALFVGILALVGIRVFEEIKGFIDYLLLQLEDIDAFVNAAEIFVINFIKRLPSFLEGPLVESATKLFSEIRQFVVGGDSQLTEKISGGIGSVDFSMLSGPLSGVIDTAKQIPTFLVNFLVTIVLSCFITADFDAVKRFIRCQLPENKQRDLTKAVVLLKSSLTKMAKAYALIMFITFCEVCLGFTVLKIFGIFNSGYIVLLAIVIAIIDIVPVLGTGTVLLPWTVYCLIVGNYPMAIGLFIMYAVITIIRQIIEPKLVAVQLGLPPFVTLTAMFLGLKIFGFLGVFVLPIAIIMLKLLNDEGIIRLWKSPSEKQDSLPDDAVEAPVPDTKE